MDSAISGMKHDVDCRGLRGKTLGKEEVYKNHQ
jgi:hypothetical protein